MELPTGYRHLEDVLVVLKEQAKKAGLELKLKVLEPTAAWKAANEKKSPGRFFRIQLLR